MLGLEGSGKFQVKVHIVQERKQKQRKELVLRKKRARLLSVSNINKNYVDEKT